MANFGSILVYVSMPFVKGQKKTGGKKKGTVNKKTAVLDSFAKDVVEGGAEKFQQELSKLKGQQYVYAYLTLFEYVRPKLSRMTLEGDADKPVELRIGYGKEE